MCYYISITIVPSYTGKYHEFVAIVLLRVRSTSNNAEGDKYVSGIAWYYGDTDFIIQTRNFIARSSTNERSECALP